MERWSGLNRVRWESPAKSCPALADLGVAHGFYGIGDIAPPLHHARQIHGIDLAAADAATTGPTTTTRSAADGVFTVEPGVTVAVKTADCVPVLFFAPGRLAMAVHAGWRGLTAGILGQAVSTAGRHGVAAEALVVAIGPAISREHYEVGDEVVQALYGTTLGLSDAEASLCVAKGRGDRWHADLPLAAVLTLLGAGVRPERLSVMQACTRSLTDWHSYRREGKGVASNWSWLTL